MSVHSAAADAGLAAYLRRISEPEHPLLARLRTENAAHRLGKMAVAPEQAALLAWLARLIRAENYLEIGVFTGYSSTAVALALPEHAKLTCCDVNASFTETARRYWAQAGVAHKITLHLQPALITLDALIQEGRAGSYDIAFIDADKPTTPHYYERCLSLVRSGGIIAIDNVLLGGRAAHPPSADEIPALGIMRKFNASLPQDERVAVLSLPVGDGLTLILKK